MARAAIVVAVAALLTFTGTASAATLVKGERSGGFAGVQDELTITTRGTVTLTVRGERQPKYRLTNRWLKRVKRHVKAARAAGLRGTYGDNNVADGFVYEFTFAGRVVTAQGAEEWPDELEALVRDFGQIYEKARAASPR